MPLPEPGPSEAANYGTPSRPRPAASVLLLRPGSGGGIEVLMLKRSPESHFMPSVWVFPGGAVDGVDGEGLDGLKRCARRELEEESGIELGPETEMVTLSRWVTPEVVKVRFDTWFFLAEAPRGVVAKPDGFEMTDAVWVTPSGGLAASESGEMAIVFPTLKQLETLVPAKTPADAIVAARGNPDADRIILPKVVGTERDHRVLLPDDPEYPAD